jgi:hypothetical protein
VASAQAVRLTAPRRTSSRKAFRMRGRSTMSVVFYQSKSLSRCFESVVSIVACSYILTDARASGRRTDRGVGLGPVDWSIRP